MNRIRTLREASSISQKELANAIGVPQSLVSYWEREKRTPSVVNGQKLADFFGVEIKDIFVEKTAQQRASCLHGRKENENEAENTGTGIRVVKRRPIT